MQNTCPNPTCGAMYNLTSQHIGRSFACKKCGSTLVVTAAGLELAGGGPVGTEPFVEPMAEESAPWRRTSSFGAEAAFTRFWEHIKADLPTWLFGTSLIIIVLCLFCPFLDKEKIARREAKRDAGTREHARHMQELNNRLNDEKTEDSDKEKIKKDIKAADKKWKETEQPKLDDEVAEASETAKSWGYWYYWGMMWGFLLLAFACLGSFRAEYPPVRRLIACIVLCALLLLALTKFLGGVHISGGVGEERRERR